MSPPAQPGAYLTELHRLRQARARNFSLDERTENQILRYIQDVVVPVEENNIPFAMQLDHDVGRPAVSNGQFKEAYEVYQKILAISYRKKSLIGLSIGLGMLARVSTELDDQDEAMKLVLLSYKIARQTNNPYEYGVVEMYLGRLAGREDRALGMQWRLRAKESLAGTHYKHDYVLLLSDLGEDLRWFGRDAEAADISVQAWELSKSLDNDVTGHRWTKQTAAVRHVSTLRRSKQCVSVVALADEVTALFGKEERTQNAYPYLLRDIGKCHAALGQASQSRDALLAAYSWYDLGRSKALGDEARAKIDSKNKILVNDFIDVLLEAGQFHEALALLETNKARTLNDILDDPQQRAVYSIWADLERRHASERVLLFDQIGKDTSQARENRYKTYQALRAKQEEERRAARTANEMREVAVGSVLTTEKLSRIQSELPRNKAVISLFYTADTVGAFLLTTSGLEYVGLNRDASLIYRAIRQLQIALSNPYTNLYREPAEILYREMFASIEARLGDEITELIYSPDGIFNRIPLGALHDGKRFLIEKYSVQRLPSLRYLNHVGRLGTARPSQGIACVDPAIDDARLPLQRQTADRLKSIYRDRVTVLAGQNCSRSKLESALRAGGDSVFLQIGAHGVFYPEDAMQSGIHLSAEDGTGRSAFWDARSMGTLDLSHLPLVTLSSCETGLTDSQKSRDVFGILRTLFFGGAENVVAPLWAVGADSTAQLMQGFYRSLSKTGSISESLRHSQLQHLKSSKFRHPYFWSGFVLTSAPT